MTSTWPSATIASAASFEHDRAAARAQGFSAGWSHGAQAAQATTVAEADRRIREAEAGLAAERARLQHAADALADVAAQLEQRTSSALAEASDAVLEIAVRLAAAVLGHEPVASATPGRDALRRALAADESGQRLRVRLNPEDAATLVAEELAALEPRVRVVPDPALARGDAMAEHEGGHLDLRLGPALDRARAVLLP